ncbi:MAG: phosphoglucosamine mutase [Candidatus Anstonellaceae archaeon]
MKLFGTSGIRDISPKILDTKFALNLGQVLAEFSKKIVVGYDGRQTGQMLAKALSSSLLGSGVEVYYLGICPSPTLCNYTKKLNAFGVNITASHNPLEYNGFKIFYKGKEATKILEKKIEAKFLSQKTKEVKNWKKAKKVLDVSWEALKEHIKLLKKIFDFQKIKRKKIKVLVDCANLAGSYASTYVLESFGVEVIKKNCSPQMVPDRGIEPNEENLKNILDGVEEEFDFAIAHDGDADRTIILDENGKMLGLDIQLAIASEYELEKAKTKKIVSTIESSLLLTEIIKKKKAKLYLTAVGSRMIAQKMFQTGAVFGGEPCGEYIYKGGVNSPDGLATAILFCEIFARRGSLAKLKNFYPSYPIKRLKIPANASEKKILMKKIEKNWPFETKIKIDGLRAFEDWGWILVRPSGTEDYIRITIETYKQRDLEEKLKAILELV